MREIERKLCDFYNANYCVFTGNGTTAMYLGFKAIGMQDRKVVFPAITCTNPVNAALYAGYDVEFCDVNLQNYTIDIEHLESVLKDSDKIIVPTHIYGHMYRRDIMADLAQKYNAIIVEDAAQTNSIGRADLSVVSFGHTKIFETCNGGGAIFCNDENLYEKIKMEKSKLRVKSKDYEAEYALYCKQYYGIMKSEMSESEKMKEMRKLQESAKEIFIFDIDNNEEIIDILERSEKICKDRLQKEEKYKLLIDKSYVNLPITEKNVKWRFSFLYNGNREYLLEKVRENGIDISSWYPSVARIYKDIELPNATEIESKIVNLWVDDSHPVEKIESDIKIINNIMRGV